MTLENKIKKDIKKGIIIGSCALMPFFTLYGANYLYHKTGGSICESRIRTAEHKVALNKENKEKMLLMKEVYEDFAKEFGYNDPDSLSTSRYMDGLVKYFEEQVKDANKQIEELTQKREIHQKRKINPFYKVFSK